MFIEASISGLFKTILIIVGAIVLLRFLGQLLQAKNNMLEEKRQNEAERRAERERQEKLRDFGKTKVMSSSKGDGVAEDVDFEEV